MIRNITFDAYYGDEVRKVEIVSHWENTYYIMVNNFLMAILILRKDIWEREQTRSPKQKEPDIEEFTSADFSELIRRIETTFPAA